MARVTVEDCVGKIPNRFELVLVATRDRVDLVQEQHGTSLVPGRMTLIGSSYECVPSRSMM